MLFSVHLTVYLSVQKTTAIFTSVLHAYSLPRLHSSCCVVFPNKYSLSSHTTRPPTPHTCNTSSACHLRYDRFAWVVWLLATLLYFFLSTNSGHSLILVTCYFLYLCTFSTSSQPTTVECPSPLTPINEPSIVTHLEVIFPTPKWPLVPPIYLTFRATGTICRKLLSRLNF